MQVSAVPTFVSIKDGNVAGTESGSSRAVVDRAFKHLNWLLLACSYNHTLMESDILEGIKNLPHYFALSHSIGDLGASSIELHWWGTVFFGRSFPLELSNALLEVSNHLLDASCIKRCEGIVNAGWFLEEWQVPALLVHPFVDRVRRYFRVGKSNSADDWVSENLETKAFQLGG